MTTTQLLILLVTLAIVQPLLLVTLGAWLWHRAKGGRGPVPDVAQALRDTVQLHRRPEAAPSSDEPEEDPVPPFRA